MFGGKGKKAGLQTVAGKKRNGWGSGKVHVSAEFRALVRQVCMPSEAAAGKAAVEASPSKGPRKKPAGKRRQSTPPPAKATTVKTQPEWYFWWLAPAQARELLNDIPFSELFAPQLPLLKKAAKDPNGGWLIDAAGQPTLAGEDAPANQSGIVVSSSEYERLAQFGALGIFTPTDTAQFV